MVFRQCVSWQQQRFFMQSTWVAVAKHNCSASHQAKLQCSRVGTRRELDMSQHINVYYFNLKFNIVLEQKYFNPQTLANLIYKQPKKSLIVTS